METPAATAAIRGTDWGHSREPDGRTLLTVLSGTVELATRRGASQGANEAAYAEVGKAPVSSCWCSRESVQWVNAPQPDPPPHLAAEPACGAGAVRAALAAGQIDRARKRPGSRRAPGALHPGAPPWVAIVRRLANGRKHRAPAQQQCPSAPLPVWLMQSDLLLMGRRRPGCRGHPAGRAATVARPPRTAGPTGPRAVA